MLLPTYHTIPYPLSFIILQALIIAPLSSVTDIDAQKSHNHEFSVHYFLHDVSLCVCLAPISADNYYTAQARNTFKGTNPTYIAIVVIIITISI